MLNTVAIQGRLTADPELRSTPAGKVVTSFCIASERSYIAKGKEKQTDFIECVAWEDTADFICKYFHKGKMIVVEGQIQTRNWQDKNGGNHKATEVRVDHAYFTDSQRKEAREMDQRSPYEDDFSQVPPDDMDLPW